MKHVESPVHVTLDFVGHVGHPFAESKLIDLVRETLTRCRAGESLSDKEVSLSVAIVDGAEIARVNKEFRDKDGETDVISIGEYADDYDITEETSLSIDLGELLLCWAFIEKSATILGEEPTYEFAYVFVHGILHLVGYEHGDEMFALQDELAHDFADDLTL